MGTITTSDFRKGLKVEVDGQPYLMAECQFVKPGKGQSLYRCRLKHLINGSTLDRTYKSGDSLNAADIREGEGTYLFKDKNGYVFMDAESYEQYHLTAEQIGDCVKFIKEDMPARLVYWNDIPITVAMPNHVVLKITYTEPAARGNTSGNVTKPATVETGAVVFVPAFVELGDNIRIDTRTGEYIERAN
jgi:elongation factor P